MDLFSQSTLSFFGPVHNWREKILEEFFALQLHLNMSYSEVRNLPIKYRRWFLDRLIQHFEMKNKAIKKSVDDHNPSQGLKDLNKFESMIKDKLDK